MQRGKKVVFIVVDRALLIDFARFVQFIWCVKKKKNTGRAGGADQMEMTSVNSQSVLSDFLLLEIFEKNSFPGFFNELSFDPLSQIVAGMSVPCKKGVCIARMIKFCIKVYSLVRLLLQI